MESDLDVTYATIMQEIVATGVAPHYAELAPRLGISPNEALNRIESILAMVREPDENEVDDHVDAT